MDSLQSEVLLDGVRIKLANLHHDLDEKYLGIINRIDDQDSTRRNIAIDALIWITHALRPLRTLELQHALAMTVEDLRFTPGRMPRQQDITAFSCGMIVHEASTETFRLVHSTAKNFIRGLGGSDSRFKDPHVKISLVISSYLCMPKLEQQDYPIQRTSPDTDFYDPLSHYNDQDVYEIQRHGGQSQDRDVYSNHTKMRVFPLAEYAAMNLGHHLRQMQGMDSALASKALEYTHMILCSRPKRKFYEIVLCETHCYPPHTFVNRYYPSEASDYYESWDEFSDHSQEESNREITSLHLAAHIGIPRLVIKLLDDKSLLQVRDHDGFNPLGIALCSGHSSLVLPLLKAGSNVDLQSSEGCRLLLFAAQSRNRVVGDVLYHIFEHHLRILDGGRHPVTHYFSWFWILAFTKIRFHGWRLIQFWRFLALWLMRLRHRLKPGSKTTNNSPSESPTAKVVQSVDAPDADGDVNPTQPQRSLARTNAEASLLPNKQEERDYLELVVAALQGDCDKINSLVEEKKVVLRIPHARKHSRTCAMIVNLALFLAIEHDKMEVVRTLIMAGVPIESRDFDERTPLHRAAAKNNKKLVEFLLENDANLEARDVRGATPWVIAAGDMHDDGKSDLAISCFLVRGKKFAVDKLKVCQLLVNSGANINSTGILGLNLLYEAAAGGHAKLVASLLRQGVNPSITTEFGWAPLHWAAGNGHMACVRLLLDYHADVNVISDIHESPLDIAMRGTHTEIVNILKDKGALSGGDIYVRRAGYLYDESDDIRSSEDESADEEDSDEEGLDGRSPEE